MKTTLTIILLLITTLTFSQLPTGHYGRFEFFGGSLINTSSGGGPDLSGTVTVGNDRNGEINDALTAISSPLTGHTLGAANINNATLAFWMKSTTPSGTKRIIQIYGASGKGFRIAFDASNLYFDGGVQAIAGQVSSVALNHAIALGDNQWHHIALRLEAINTNQVIDIDMFVDGVLQSDLSNTNLDPSGSSEIGTFLSAAELRVNPTSTYTGSLDDIYLYKSALTDAQILDIYNYTPVIVSQPINYVDHNASGNNDGSSWADAYTSLDTALANVNSGEQIWVAAGTYVTQPSTSFILSTPNIEIYGGFAGTETLITERVLGSNETILSGDVNGNDVFVGNSLEASYNHTSKNDNASHVVVISATADNTLLDGLTISNGHNYSTSLRGAGIFKNSAVANLTIKNCIMKNNIARAGGAGLVADYGLSSSNNIGSLIIENSKFINNRSLYGAGLFSSSTSYTNLEVKVENTLFDNNIVGDLNSGSTSGLSATSAWFRSLSSNAEVNVKLINSTFVNSIDDTYSSNINNTTRAVVAINRTAGIVEAEVVNCIFWNNKITSTTNINAFGNTYQTAAQSIDVRNSIDEANFTQATITSTTNTSNANPLFINATDYRLQSGSPAINAGDNSFVTTSTDLLGNQRIFDTTVDLGVYEFGSSTLSTDNFNVLKNTVSIYPNPATSVLHIEMDQDLKQATIYSLLGKQVLRTQNSNVDVSTLSNGVYLMKIETENGNVLIKRFVKK